MKPCIHCKEIKPLSEFYLHPQMKDGHLNKCKACAKAYAAAREIRLNKTSFEWREAELNRQREKSRKRYKNGYRPNVNAFKRGRDRWTAANREKREAHIKVNNAVRDGKLVQKPCEKCGAVNAEAHHDDYSKPLDVRWLCVTHHNEHHNEERKRKRLSGMIILAI